MSTVDALSTLIQSARGSRPQSLVSAEAEEALSVGLALLVELAASNDRIDRLERLVAELRGEHVGALRAIVYEGEAAEERKDAMEMLLMRGMRIFLDPRLAQADGAPAA